MLGAATGTTPLIVAAESAVGIKDGGRTGLAAVVVSGCFAACLFLAPLFKVGRRGGAGWGREERAGGEENGDRGRARDGMGMGRLGGHQVREKWEEVRVQAQAANRTSATCRVPHVPLPLSDAPPPA